MKDKLSKKNKSLKSAIERYNTYKRFVDLYKKTNSLEEYIQYVQLSMGNMSEGLVQHYNEMFRSYSNGNEAPLLSNLYDRLLESDEYKNKVSAELKSLLREL